VNELQIAVVRLIWIDPNPGPPAPRLLRGAIADRFRGNALFHQHGSEGLVYRYPRIQYRWDHSGAAVIGFGDGVQSLMDLPWPGLSLRLGSRFLTVLDAECSLRRHVVKPTDRLIRYRFGSPWIPFNQDNIPRYRAMSPEEQAAERDRLAVAGLLIGLRGLGVGISFRLYASFESRASQRASFESRASQRCEYKNLSLTGFRGTLLANLDLPDGMAIGRAVSHGYGWLTRELSIAEPPR
jgi:hypothetical protein